MTTRRSISALTALVLAASLLPASSSAEASYPFHFLSRRTHMGFPQSVATADINGDGYQDVIIYGTGPPAFSTIAFGHGDGTFEQDVPSNVDGFGKGSVFCDLNRDGKADFVLYSGTGLTVALGHGDGTFGPSTNVPGDPSLSGGLIFAGDIDGDGWIDIATGPPGHLVIWRNHQDGTLEPYVTRDVGLTAVALQDLDSDGKLDLGGFQLDGGGMLRIAVAKGHGDGTFDPSVLSALGTPDAFGDADGDGLADALVGDTYGPTSICFGNGPDSFGDAQLVGSFEPVAFADVNGDGRDEIIGYLYSFLVVHVAPDRTLGPTDAYPAPGTLPFQKVADLNGDGRPDFAGVSDAFNQFHVILSDGAGGFHEVPQYPTGARPMRVQLADLDRDGNLDVIHTNALDGTISVRLGDGGGHFGPRSDFPAGTQPMALAVADVNHDGLLDVAVADSVGNDVQVLIGNGAGGLGPPAPNATGSGPVDIALADLNGDGILDVVTANRTGQSLSVLLGNGDGTFGAHSDFNAGLPARRVALADLTGDGHLDAVAFGNGNRVAVLLGNGSGGFGPAALTFVNNGGADDDIWGALSLRDWNGDGKVDVVAATLKRMTFLPGNGNGTFGASQQTLSLFGATDIAMGDVDQDGKPDLIISADMASGGYNAGALTTYFGNGDGTFQWGTGYGADLFPSGLAVGDLNGDGFVDAVVVNALSNNLDVFLHATNGPVPALASIASAEALTDRVRLVWQGAPYVAATLYRRVATGEWTVVAPVVGDPSGRITYEDDDVTAGQSYSYRLGAGIGASEIFFGDVTVHMPLGLSFALSGSVANPTQGPWNVAFTLPGTGSAHLDIVNLAGRIVATRSVGQLGPGSHVLSLPETRSLGAGIYFLRLTRGTETKLAKVVATR